jgi:folate-binding protein YgfZ
MGPRISMMQTPLLAQHQTAGATLADFLGCTLPEKFGDWQSEWRVARESVALFDTNCHSIVILKGPDRVRYLHAIVSNDVRSLAEDDGARALLLNPQGHILFELQIHAQQDQLLVLSHASVRDLMISTLDKYIIMDDVELEDATERLGTIAFEGPRAGIVASQLTGLALEGFAELAGEHIDIGGVPCYLICQSHFGFPGVQLVAPREHLAALWKVVGASVDAEHGAVIGMQALNALRLEVGVPWFPLDFDDSIIANEAGLDATHLSFTKGCYTGQEIVERVRSRGHVNRRRVRLNFSTPDPPPSGTNLRASDSEAGHVTSAAFSPAAGTAIGMAYVRREYNSPGSILEYAGGKATVID